MGELWRTIRAWILLTSTVESLRRSSKVVGGLFAVWLRFDRSRAWRLFLHLAVSALVVLACWPHHHHLVKAGLPPWGSGLVLGLAATVVVSLVLWMPLILVRKHGRWRDICARDAFLQIEELFAQSQRGEIDDNLVLAIIKLIKQSTEEIYLITPNLVFAQPRDVAVPASYHAKTRLESVVKCLVRHHDDFFQALAETRAALHIIVPDYTSKEVRKGLRQREADLTLKGGNLLQLGNGMMGVLARLRAIREPQNCATVVHPTGFVMNGRFLLVDGRSFYQPLPSGRAGLLEPVAFLEGPRDNGRLFVIRSILRFLARAL